MSSLNFGVFWDYENIRVPQQFGADIAANCIRTALCTLTITGVQEIQVVERRIYFDSNKPTERSLDRSRLDLSGFTLVDCPTRNKKETMDKKIIVDIMFSATLHKLSGQRFGVALISSDGDYAYMLNRLRDMGIFTVLIHSGLAGQPPITPTFLLNSSDVVMHWKSDVLEGQTSRFMKANEEEMTNRKPAPSSGPSKCESSPGANAGNGGAGQTELSQEHLIEEEEVKMHCANRLVCNDPGEGGFDAFLTITAMVAAQDSWARHSQVANAFYHSLGTADKDKFKMITASCHQQSLIVFGRRRLLSNEIVEVSAMQEVPVGCAPELYIKLSSGGVAVLNRPECIPGPS